MVNAFSWFCFVKVATSGQMVITHYDSPNNELKQILKFTLPVVNRNLAPLAGSCSPRSWPSYPMVSQMRLAHPGFQLEGVEQAAVDLAAQKHPL
jgi:hypothetical protein